MAQGAVLAGLAAAGVAIAHAGPGLTAIGPVRRRLFPQLAGLGRPDHVALTFDDGPDPASCGKSRRRTGPMAVRPGPACALASPAAASPASTAPCAIRRCPLCKRLPSSAVTVASFGSSSRHAMSQ